LAETTYTVFAVPSSGVCASPNGPHQDQALDGPISIEAHELLETATDPLPGSGYMHAAGNEVGDECSWLFGPTSSALSGTYNELLNGDEYLLQDCGATRGQPARSVCTHPPR
jgi:hypothetical protein